jgi:redox-sensitive bicupin YhaK (pirin superfamily)
MAMELRRYEELGSMQYGWLNAHYHFSFSSYLDRNRMGLGELRVINDDIVAVGGGFDFHPHRDMEIITYVREGAITHEDSLGNRGVTAAGDIQVMSAGTGIVHAERNEGDVPTKLYQIWIQPRTRGVVPRWEARAFPKAHAGVQLLASGLPEHEGAGALMIHQDAALWGGKLAAGARHEQSLKGAGYLLVSQGEVQLGDVCAKAGDGIQLQATPSLALTALADSEIVLIDLPNA